MTLVSDIRLAELNSIISVIEKIRIANSDQKFVLIVDTQSLPILSSLVSTTDLVDKNVVLTELYENKRQPLPYHAVYLLHPSTDISILINDFSPKPNYTAAHVLFTYTCNQSIIEALTQRPDVVKRILTMVDLYIHYIAIEPNFFVIQSPGAFISYHSSRSIIPWSSVCNELVRGLVSFFFTLKTTPLIAYPKGSDVLPSLARSFGDHMSSVIAENPSISFSNNNSLLIIVPRAADAVAPLLHQFSYQAMIRENMDIDNDTITVKNPKSGDCVVPLNVYHSSLFANLRYSEFSEYSNSITSKFNEVRDYERRYQSIIDSETGEKKSFALKQLAKAKKDHDEIINHYTLCTQLSDMLSDRDLIKVSEFEQEMVIQSKNTTFEDLSTLILNPKPSPLDKARIIALYSLKTKNLNGEQLSRITSTARISDYSQAIRNLEFIRSSHLPRKNPINPSNPNPLKTDKFFPLVSEIVSDVYDDKLNSSVFEKPPHTGRYQNIVLFIVGGISYMELKSLNELKEKLKGTKLFIGSTNTLTPQQYLAQIGAISSQ